MTELKACPFCGGRARLFRIGHQKGTAFDDWGIECVKCGAMPWAFSTYCGNDQAEIHEKCATKWNRRAGGDAE